MARLKNIHGFTVLSFDLESGTDECWIDNTSLSGWIFSQSAPRNAKPFDIFAMLCRGYSKRAENCLFWPGLWWECLHFWRNLMHFPAWVPTWSSCRGLELEQRCLQHFFICALMSDCLLQECKVLVIFHHLNSVCLVGSNIGSYFPWLSHIGNVIIQTPSHLYSPIICQASSCPNPSFAILVGKSYSALPA